MITTFVRRLRLATELKTLREEVGLTHAELAAKIGQSRPQISRLENAHVAPDQNDIIKILDALGVEGERWSQVLTIAQEAAAKGWWEPTAKAMGERQALFANLEAGAVSICQYQQTFVPGLLQTPEFTRVRVESEWVQGPASTTTGAGIDGVTKGRAGRQRMLHRQGGPTYEAILDEAVVRRISAPPHVLRAQLLRLIELARTEKIKVQMLPVDAQIEGYSFPACSFSIFRYPDPGDPTVVAVEAVTSDLVLTHPDQTRPHTEMYDRLRAAALPIEASIDLITQAAARLPDSA
ncbi:helix-turn-helix domain-containing protein [Streptosporangium lutulentum]|uniref:Transcriptional regulator with XRE-family HTH domain n=1 Tax=Streptosporangium lutulentum TaxID=1461250 RepID=A0ABT9QUM7_9ACTN|nr:helix-turn-helix transcriptional regulator [Streptosporangium lutulentum]MDP9850454.1 transcriptional regulator with XRE-family HTH domain [Streptosporangium lutulentum]